MSMVNSLTAAAPHPPQAPAEGPLVKDAPAFDFYPERWLVGVAGMSDAEQLSYLRLLCHQWLLGDAGLPGDVPALKRLAGAKGVTPAVLAKLPPGVDGRRRNARLEVIRGEQRERIAKSREKITKMNLARAAGKAAPPKGGMSRKGGSAVGASLGEAQGDLQEALQGGRGEGLGEAVEESLQGGLEGRLREGRGDDLGEVLDGSLNGFLTTHRSPPTPVPEDANNAGAGAREAGAAVKSAALGAASTESGARAAADAAADSTFAAEEDEAAARAAADAAADRAAAAEAAAERAAKAERSKAVAEATPSLETVKAWAVGIGCPPDKAEIWWHEHEARPLSVFGCWTDRDGNAVRRPQHALAAWWQKWRANDQQRSTRLHAPSAGSYQGGARPAVAAVRSDSANRPGRYA